MHRILRDFYLAELRGLLPLLAAIALLLGYLILRGLFPVQAILFCPLLAVLASLRAWLSSTAFRNAFETLPLARQEHIAREYTQPHPAGRSAPAVRLPALPQPPHPAFAAQ